MSQTQTAGRSRDTRRRNKHGEIIYEFLVRLEEPLYEALTARADQDRMSKVEVIRTALRRHL